MCFAFVCKDGGVGWHDRRVAVLLDASSAFVCWSLKWLGPCALYFVVFIRYGGFVLRFYSLFFLC
jgi:hypothetical protein